MCACRYACIAVLPASNSRHGISKVCNSQRRGGNTHCAQKYATIFQPQLFGRHLLSSSNNWHFSAEMAPAQQRGNCNTSQLKRHQPQKPLAPSHRWVVGCTGYTLLIALCSLWMVFISRNFTEDIARRQAGPSSAWGEVHGCGMCRWGTYS